ncbi:Small RNA degrading nuclease 2 [Platanthera zijinensis]|uniref:RNA exonuclease 4 n=1 Tax=Platanthera zijinensis TaxID=2320716 RepID=A0AAP0B8A5_9ASPA
MVVCETSSGATRMMKRRGGSLKVSKKERNEERIKKKKTLQNNGVWLKLQTRLQISCRRHVESKRKSRREKPIMISALFTFSLSSTSSSLSTYSSDLHLTEEVSTTCRVVGLWGRRPADGRVTPVNTWGNVVYDEYVRPLDYVVDFRTKISGIRPKNLKKAKEFMTVQKKVAELIKGRILVGHALHNDLKVLLLSHPRKDIRDTSEYQPLFREGRKRSLRYLAAEILDVKIQQKEHCSQERASMTRLFYFTFVNAQWKRNWKIGVDYFPKKRKVYRLI